MKLVLERNKAAGVDIFQSIPIWFLVSLLLG
jgi:hypothetical protein